MGRKTWESVGKPLPNRQNIVVSRHLNHIAGVEIAKTLNEAFGIVQRPAPVFVIGGEYFYKEALKFAELAFLTEIHKDFEGDVFFPKLDATKWIERSRQPRGFDGSAGFSYDFVEYVRRGASPN